VNRDDIAGKRVLVTAAATGIGATIAARFAERGARPYVCDVDGDALAAYLSAHPDIAGRQADVASDADVEAFVAAGVRHLGGLDVLVSNAGIAGPAAPVEEMDADGWRRTLDVNLTGAFLCARAVVPHLKAGGGGSIVVMSSNAGTMGLPFRGPYVATKWGLIGLVKSLAMELGPYGIRVNAICPGSVAGARIDAVFANKAALRGVPPDVVRAEALAKTSLRRLVTADDIAHAIVFLASPVGANISGHALPVDADIQALV